MVKVITYGTYDCLHFGHVRLLERAKSLGDYLIVGVTSDDFDRARGKINVQQSLMERIEAVRSTGIADEIIIEEYEGQKIDDIKKYGIDVFTVGSDWKGKFDYLNEYCKVVYLPRTKGVSSTEIRAKKRSIKLALIGDKFITNKFLSESAFVDGLESELLKEEDYKSALDSFDAFYFVTNPKKNYENIKYALKNGKHVLCESPISMSLKECDELQKLAQENKCILFDGIKTAFSVAYNRLLVQAKSGKIGRILSVDATCTSMRELSAGNGKTIFGRYSFDDWGPTALLPIFQLLGTDYRECNIISAAFANDPAFDGFTKIDFLYDDAVASLKIAKAAKSEGDLVITGTKGYIYVPAPWWKTDYYEIRYENQEKNIRQFYQLDGEGIRYELVVFLRSIESGNSQFCISKNITEAICRIAEKFYGGAIRKIEHF